MVRVRRDLAGDQDAVDTDELLDRLVGRFGLAEILLTAGQKNPPAVIRPRLRELLPSRQEWREAHLPIWRGTGIGFLIGIIPGSAHVIGSAIDRAGIPDILGNVAGDDTLLVVCSEHVSGAKVAAELAALAGL